MELTSGLRHSVTLRLIPPHFILVGIKVLLPATNETNKGLDDVGNVRKEGGSVREVALNLGVVCCLVGLAEVEESWVGRVVDADLLLLNGPARHMVEDESTGDVGLF